MAAIFVLVAASLYTGQPVQLVTGHWSAAAGRFWSTIHAAAGGRWTGQIARSLCPGGSSSLEQWSVAAAARSILAALPSGDQCDAARILLLLTSTSVPLGYCCQVLTSTSVMPLGYSR